MEPVGLIAGNGELPCLFAREARSSGHRVVAVAHRGETTEALAKEVDSIVWVRGGELGRLIDTLKAAGVRQAVMVGGINKVRSLGELSPDPRSLAMLEAGTTTR